MKLFTESDLRTAYEIGRKEGNKKGTYDINIDYHNLVNKPAYPYNENWKTKVLFVLGNDKLTVTEINERICKYEITHYSSTTTAISSMKIKGILLEEGLRNYRKYFLNSDFNKKNVKSKKKDCIKDDNFSDLY